MRYLIGTAWVLVAVVVGVAVWAQAQTAVSRTASWQLEGTNPDKFVIYLITGPRSLWTVACEAPGDQRQCSFSAPDSEQRCYTAVAVIGQQTSGVSSVHCGGTPAAPGFIEVK